MLPYMLYMVTFTINHFSLLGNLVWALILTTTWITLNDLVCRDVVCTGRYITWLPGQTMPWSVWCRMPEPFSKLWNKGGNVHFCHLRHNWILGYRLTTIKLVFCFVQWIISSVVQNLLCYCLSNAIHCMGQNIKSLAACVCLCVCVCAWVLGVEYLENA